MSLKNWTSLRIAAPFGLALLALATAVFISGVGRSGAKTAAVPGAPLAEVTVAAVIHRPLREWEEFTGRLQAMNTVEVLRHVEGTSGARRVGTDAMSPTFAQVLPAAFPAAELVDGEVAMQAARRIKTGPELAVLITDAISATGMPDGRYQLGGLDVEVHDGKCLMNGSLAGSVLTMDRALRNVMKFGGWDLQDAVRAASLNPAKAVGVSDRKGAIVAGADADLVVLSSAGEVRNTMVNGKITPE